jgi:hypothetical protein
MKGARVNRSLSIFLGVLVIGMLTGVSAEAQTNLVSVSPVPASGVFLEFAGQ